MPRIDDDNESPRLTLPVSERDHQQGPASAPVTLLEYGDYQCPYCGAAYPVVKRLQEALGKKLRFVFRNFPLTESHPYAEAAADTAEAAALQNKFWEMHDQIYEHQESLAPETLVAWAQELGLDMNKFKAALEKGPVAKRIKEDRSSGIRSGVNGTPTFFINGIRYDGPPDYDSLLSVLEDELTTPASKKS